MVDDLIEEKNKIVVIAVIIVLAILLIAALAYTFYKNGEHKKLTDAIV